METSTEQRYHQVSIKTYAQALRSNILYDDMVLAEQGNNPTVGYEEAKQRFEEAVRITGALLEEEGLVPQAVSAR